MLEQDPPGSSNPNPTPSPRVAPYVWTTWVTKPMAAEQQCDYAPWFKAHFTYPKLASDFDLAKWTAEHGEMVRAKAAELREQGYTVFLEDQNSFRVRGQSGAILSGKPDLVAIKGDEVRVLDCKTGTPKHSDQFQVMLYMYVLPKTNNRYHNKTIRGEVVYKTQTVDVAPHLLDETFQNTLTVTMRRVTAITAPDPTPSYGECRFCDISKDYCPMRVDTPPAEVAVDFF